MVYAEQLAPLVVELVLGGVDVLRALVVAHRAGAEAEHLAARIRQGEHDPPAETVVEATVPAPLPEPGRGQLLAAEAEPLRGHHHAVPRAGRLADAELAQDLLPQAAARQVLAGAPRLGQLPQHLLVVGRGPLDKLQQALAAPPPLLR